MSKELTLSQDEIENLVRIGLCWRDNADGTSSMASMLPGAGVANGYYCSAGYIPRDSFDSWHEIADRAGKIGPETLFGRWDDNPSGYSNKLQMADRSGLDLNMISLALEWMLNRGLVLRSTDGFWVRI